MFVIQARNVNYAYVAGINYLLDNGVRQSSRAGDVLVSPVPVTTVYSHPCERVLTDPLRDANPFFHIMEALWMLAGGKDARWLDQFVSDFSARFAELDGSQHGAYGDRWRHHFGTDQLQKVIDLLRKNPGDRRAVLTMWDPRVDLGVDAKDIPCNTQVFLRIQRRLVGASLLDITVCCRSNDTIWGCYGANAVHFSVLQEYLAAMLGVGVGAYYQVSNNFHLYVDALSKISDRPFHVEGHSGPYLGMRPQPMITAPEAFEADLRVFMEWTRWGTISTPFSPSTNYVYSNPWFAHTAEPLFAANNLRRQGRLDLAQSVVGDPDFDMAPDWRLAASQWLARRVSRVKMKKG